MSGCGHVTLGPPPRVRPPDPQIHPFQRPLPQTSPAGPFHPTILLQWGGPHNLPFPAAGPHLRTRPSNRRPNPHTRWRSPLWSRTPSFEGGFRKPQVRSAGRAPALPESASLPKSGDPRSHDGRPHSVRDLGAPEPRAPTQPQNNASFPNQFRPFEVTECRLRSRDIRHTRSAQEGFTICILLSSLSGHQTVARRVNPTRTNPRRLRWGVGAETPYSPLPNQAGACSTHPPARLERDGLECRRCHQ